ncbi:MAG: heavy metal translocating P-type ATPase [Clostridiales bacterium]|nr:heavy metal translocating P-type ATPase [Clostridiales bacterium]
MKKKELANLFLSFVVLIAGVLAEHGIFDIGRIFNVSFRMEENIILAIFLFAYFIVGGDVLKTAAENILHGQIFDENFLMSIATIGAFLVGEYPEAVAVMLFYQIGEMFQSYAVNKSRKSIAELMDIKPDVAFLKQADGNIVKKSPNEINIGDIIIVKAGEKIPLDGVILNGHADVDTAALTGESVPRFQDVGDTVISGTININGVIEVEVLKRFEESTVSKILELVENASSKKAKTEKFITKFARYYTPVVVIAALALALIPTAISGFDLEVLSIWGYRACSFLVISCPCALVISVPLSFFGGIGAASANGILVKGSNYLEALAKCGYMICDKTGTLTKGNFKISKIYSVTGNDDEILHIATIAERNSNHPIARSLMDELQNRDSGAAMEINRIIQNDRNNSNIEEIAGCGIKTMYMDKNILVGNEKLMQQNNIEYVECNEAGTVVHVANGGKYLGYLLIQDEIKEDTPSAISDLRKLGVEHIIMLTGDAKDIANNIAGRVGISEVYAELLPNDKVEKTEAILKESHESKVAFVGDGINDAPVLACVDVGIAMGGLGSDAAIEAADVVIMDDKMSGLVKAIKIARKTMIIVKENIAFALGIKFLILILAAFGIANMWMAVFADVGVAFLAILNSLRALHLRK